MSIRAHVAGHEKALSRHKHQSTMWESWKNKQKIKENGWEKIHRLFYNEGRTIWMKAKRLKRNQKGPCRKFSWSAKLAVAVWTFFNLADELSESKRILTNWLINISIGMQLTVHGVMHQSASHNPNAIVLKIIAEKVQSWADSHWRSSWALLLVPDNCWNVYMAKYICIAREQRYRRMCWYSRKRSCRMRHKSAHSVRWNCSTQKRYLVRCGTLKSHQ